MKNCTPLRREAHLEVKMYKTHHARTTFGSCDVEKMHAVVARSTFPSHHVQTHTRFGALLEAEMSAKVHAVVARSTFRSQHVQNTPRSDHFWKLRCRKSACRCGAKHISKPTCTKHATFGPLLEVAMSKKCTSLWRETHFDANMYKTHHVRTTFGSCDVEKMHTVVARSTFRRQHVQNTKKHTTFGPLHAVVARSTCRSQHVQNTPRSDHFWKLRCRKSAQRCGVKHISKSTCTKHTTFGPLLEAEMSAKVHAIVARSTFRSQHVQNTPRSDDFWKLRCRKNAPLWREAHFEANMYKTHHVRTTFGS